MHFSEGEDYELLDGELIPLPSASPQHNKIRYRLERLVEDYFVRSPIGETYDGIACCLALEIIRRPDLSIFLNGGVGRVDEICRYLSRSLQTSL